MNIIKKEKFPKAFVEIKEILNHMEKEDVEKIPKDFRNMINENMAKDYVFKLNQEKPLEEQAIMRETKVILAYIFMHYLGMEKQKIAINQKFKQDILKEEDKKRNEYPVDVFKKENQETLEKYRKNTQLIEYQEKSFMDKIFEKIKSIFLKLFKK